MQGTVNGQSVHFVLRKQVWKTIDVGVDQQRILSRVPPVKTTEYVHLMLVRPVTSTADWGSTWPAWTTGGQTTSYTNTRSCTTRASLWNPQTSSWRWPAVTRFLSAGRRRRAPGSCWSWPAEPRTTPTSTGRGRGPGRWYWWIPGVNFTNHWEALRLSLGTWVQDNLWLYFRLINNAASYLENHSMN